MSGAEPVIAARDLRKYFPARGGPLKAVDGIDLAIHEGEVLGLVGESGSGKTTAGMTLLHLYEPTGGEVRFGGIGALAGANARTMRSFRRQAQIVFQNPYEALNPRETVEQALREPLAIHFPRDREAQREKMLRAMERAGLNPAETYLPRYPHQLSGGQLQRVAIARAIVLEPRFLVADEPVSMLDVSIRAGILNLIRHFAGTLKMAVLYVSHDLSTMRHVCSSIAVMYLGRIVEEGPAEQVLDAPLHPYAQALIAAVPVMGGRGQRPRVQLAGAPGSAADLPPGCRFHPRCPKAFDRCGETEPELRAVTPTQRVACHLYD